MPKISNNFICLFCATLLTGMLIVSAGCDQTVPSSGESTGNASANKKLPKLTFHRPKNLEQAARRMHAIHDALVSNGDLPAPTVFHVVETVHGNHSHYHLAGNEYHGHHEDGEAEVLHDYEVDLFTEMVDIARWLPKTAGESDLGEDDWNGVKTLSVKLEQLLNKLFNDSAIDEKRKSYQANAEAVNKMIGDLDKVAFNKN